MIYFDRHDICAAYALYAMLWAPEASISARLRHLGYRPSVLARLEDANENVKAIYGSLVRRNSRLLVGFERLYRKRPELAGSWPGTRNIPGGDVRRYLESRGLLAAVEALCS